LTDAAPRSVDAKVMCVELDRLKVFWIYTDNKYYYYYYYYY